MHSIYPNTPVRINDAKATPPLRVTTFIFSPAQFIDVRLPEHLPDVSLYFGTINEIGCHRMHKSQESASRCTYTSL